MAGIKSIFLLGLLSTTAFTTPTKRTICSAGRKTINGVEYTLSCGMDRAGGDYGLKGPNASWDDCQNACSSDTTCVTAQYHEDRKFCYLKNAVNQPSIKSGEDTIDRGFACQKSKTYTLNGLQCTVSCATDRHGGDYSSAYTGNYLSCASACVADNRCATAQYNEGNGYCYLKDSINDAVSSDNTDSVVCIRPGSTTTTTVAQTTSTTMAPATTTTQSALKAQGATCIRSSECQSNLCTSTNYCGPLPNGYFCGVNSECVSGNCYKDPPTAGYGECKAR